MRASLASLESLLQLVRHCTSDVKSESKPAIILAGYSPLETPENSRQVIRGDTNPMILDHQHGFPISGLKLNINRMAGAILGGGEGTPEAGVELVAELASANRNDDSDGATGEEATNYGSQRPE